MKRIIRYKLMWSAIIALFFSDCKKLVEIDAPISQLATPSVFSDNATATSALVNIYETMFQNREFYRIELETGLAGDEFVGYNSDNIPFYINALDPLANYSPWNGAYNYIYQSNEILEALQNNTIISPSVRKQLIGEAKFIRAFWHFYLINFYGDVPLVLSTDYTINKSIVRSPKEQVYQQVILDLTEAIGLMSSNFIDASDTTSTSERVRPNKWAAMALLARAYLYTEDYAKAEEQASEIINNTFLFNLVTDLNRVFEANSSEAIWQLAPPLNSGSNGGNNTTEGSFFILNAQPTIVALRPQLVAAFVEGDTRRSNWIDSFSTVSPTAIYYYPYKYKIKVDPTPTTTEEYTMILRLSEQYLIRAEARIRQNKVAEGIDDINIIRRRARALPTIDIPDPLPDLSTSLSQADALIAVLHERQVELFTEVGHRWFDMIRMGYANSIMGEPGNVCQMKGGTWNPYEQLFPIPQSERNKDANLTQNPGYN